MDNFELYWIDKLDKIYGKDLREYADKYFEKMYHRGNVPYTPKMRERIKYYFDSMLKIHNKARTGSKNYLEKYKKLYYKKYVIKEDEIPESYFTSERERLKNKGLEEKSKEEMINDAIKDQEKAISNYIDFFLDEYTSKLNNGKYEMYEMFWAFQGLKKLGKYDNKKLKFSKRNKNTVYTFPKINKEALVQTINIAEDYIKHVIDPSFPEKIPSLKEAYHDLNFKKIYEYVLKEEYSKRYYSNEGIWVKYEKGSNYQKLENDLDNAYTGWCTADSSLQAMNQLNMGAFYVYYTRDLDGNYSIPRIAITTKDEEVIEVRGIDQNQNLEPELINIVQEKLKEFKPSRKYNEIINDTIKTNQIYEKTIKNIDLSLEELIFLYDIKGLSKTFGTKDDHRKEEIIKLRDNFKDLETIFNTKEISMNPSDPKEVFLGDLITDDIDNLPEYVLGNLIITNDQIKNFKMPKLVTKSIKLNNLEKARNLDFSGQVGDSIESSIKTVSMIKMPNVINNMSFPNLSICFKINFPEIVYGNINLNSLTTLDNTIFPEEVYGYINLDSLVSLNNVIMPEYTKYEIKTPNLIQESRKVR